MRIAFFGDYIALTTAYGQNIYRLAKRLKARGHEVYNVTPSYIGLPITVDGINVYSSGPEANLSVQNGSFYHALEKIQPDVVIHHRDNWHYTPYNSSGPQYHLLPLVHEFGAKLVNYTPVESYPLCVEMENTYAKEGDFTITTTKYGLEYVKQFTDHADYLYHGINENLHRVEYEGRPFELPEGNMFLSIGNANNYRKMSPLLLAMFLTYLRLSGDEKAYLFLQMQPRDWYALDSHIHTLGMERHKDRVIFSSKTSPDEIHYALTDQQLNLLYNAATAYITLPASEGFGMTALEAAALGLPTFVTDLPVFREILKPFQDHVAFVPSKRIYPTVWNFEWLADTDAGGDELTRWNDVKLLKKSRMHVPPEYNWDNIALKLERILEGVV